MSATDELLRVCAQFGLAICTPAIAGGTIACNSDEPCDPPSTQVVASEELDYPLRGLSMPPSALLAQLQDHKVVALWSGCVEDAQTPRPADFALSADGNVVERRDFRDPTCGDDEMRVQTTIEIGVQNQPDMTLHGEGQIIISAGEVNESTAVWHDVTMSDALALELEAGTSALRLQVTTWMDPPRMLGSLGATESDGARRCIAHFRTGAGE